MNHFRYDVSTKSYSFGSLGSDQLMDLTGDEKLVYYWQQSAWLHGEGEIHELLILMAKTDAIHEHNMYTCGGKE